MRTRDTAVRGIAFEYSDFELAMAATVAAARRTRVPVAIHLDHGVSCGSAVRSINLGCNGVMVDASRQSFAANVSATCFLIIGCQ